MEKYDELLRLFSVKNPIGYTADDIDKAKAAVGEIPLELEQFYRYCGNSPELHHLQDELILPNRYAAFLNLDYIVFFDENQGVCQAAVKKTDALLDNPPVYTNDAKGEWKLSSPSVSDFLKVMFDYQASICLPFSPEEFYFVSEDEKVKIEQIFPRLGGFDNWLYDFNITVYGENGGRVALMENIGGGSIQMNFAANNEVEFKRMSALLNGIGEAI